MKTVIKCNFTLILECEIAIDDFRRLIASVSDFWLYAIVYMHLGAIGPYGQFYEVVF